MVAVSLGFLLLLPVSEPSYLYIIICLLAIFKLAGAILLISEIIFLLVAERYGSVLSVLSGFKVISPPWGFGPSIFGT